MLGWPDWDSLRRDTSAVPGRAPERPSWPHRGRIAIAVAVLLAALTPLGYAGATTTAGNGTLAGKVTDNEATPNPIAGICVFIQGAGQTKFTTTTGNNGVYSI